MLRGYAGVMRNKVAPLFPPTMKYLRLMNAHENNKPAMNTPQQQH